MVLVDPYGRPINQLRISVTVSCNYDCIFCHREGIESLAKRELCLSDWVFLLEVAYSLGVREVKVTGGEPLLKPFTPELVGYAVQLGFRVSLVTNGYFLTEYVDKLAETGLDHLNVSLVSLKPCTYTYLTRYPGLEKVLEGVKEALDYDLRVKANVLVTSMNYSEFREIIAFLEGHGIDANVIELIPLGMPPNLYKALHKPLDDIIRFLEEYSSRSYVGEFQNRPVYVLPSGVEVTVIRGYGNPMLCMKCTRLRLTPDGRIKTCLYTDTYVDAYNAIKDRDRLRLIKVFEEAVRLRRPYFMPRDVGG